MEEKRTFEVGGMRVTKLVNQKEIDQFVQNLPEESKQDVKDVIMALHQQGLIKIEEV
ncbi:hypothetical protein [Anaerobranca gottschalkii]|uniref:Uncharacterized protein n=1 Tax=Anaerobranca gottschalkii DSM 13577 TaxID=1120990 RepID=A0A1I0AM68_9FIRM|nr:hypothetical protein [Anaerobranca gottschalkii]SES95407.1 hypothetical protein SAMN03080614_10248 [Anaerobranca gottschalkii DSM 13577]